MDWPHRAQVRSRAGLAVFFSLFVHWVFSFVVGVVVTPILDNVCLLTLGQCRGGAKAAPGFLGHCFQCGLTLRGEAERFAYFVTLHRQAGQELAHFLG